MGVRQMLEASLEYAAAVGVSRKLLDVAREEPDECEPLRLDSFDQSLDDLYRLISAIVLVIGENNSRDCRSRLSHTAARSPPAPARSCFVVLG